MSDTGDMLVWITGRLGFAYDGRTLFVRLLVDGVPMMKKRTSWEQMQAQKVVRVRNRKLRLRLKRNGGMSV